MHPPCLYRRSASAAGRRPLHPTRGVKPLRDVGEQAMQYALEVRQPEKVGTASGNRTGSCIAGI
jgi:hypothetical protein